MPNSQKPNATNDKSVFIFQLPNKNTAFIGLPGTTNSNPRILTIPENKTLVIIPNNEQEKLPNPINNDYKESQQTILSRPGQEH